MSAVGTHHPVDADPFQCTPSGRRLDETNHPCVGRELADRQCDARVALAGVGDDEAGRFDRRAFERGEFGRVAVDDLVVAIGQVDRFLLVRVDEDVLDLRTIEFVEQDALAATVLTDDGVVLFRRQLVVEHDRRALEEGESRGSEA